MKKIITLSVLLFLASCNQEKKEVKFIPLTTNSIEAKKAFMEGVYRFDQNEINESRAAYKKAVELDDDFLLAKVYYNSTIPSENRERIIYSYENRDNVSQIEKKIIEANYKMQVYGDFKGAISIFDTLISNNPDIPFLYETTGYMKSFNKDFDIAIEYWKKAIELNPNSYFSAICLGLLNVTVGTSFMPLPEEKRNLEEGKKWLELAAKMRPEASATPRFMGNIYRAENELDKALDAYRLAVNKNVNKSSQLMEQTLMVGHTLNAMGKYDEARSEYLNTIDVSINDFWWAQNHVYYSYTLLAEKRYDEAIRFLSKAQQDLSQKNISKEILDFSLNRIEFNKWLIIAHSLRKDEADISLNKLNQRRKKDYEKSMLEAIDELEKENLTRNFMVGNLSNQAWSSIIFGEYDLARQSLNKMYEIQKNRLADNPDALNRFNALSGYLNLMEGNIEESINFYKKRKERGDLGEYHNYFYALSLKANGESDKSKQILISLANNPFSDWDIAIVKNLAKAQIKTNI